MSDPANGLLAAAALFLVAGLLLPPAQWSRRLGATVPYLPGLVASVLIGLAAAAILISGQPSTATLPSLVPGASSLVRLDPIGTYFLLLVAAADAIVFGFLAVAASGGERPAALRSCWPSSAREPLAGTGVGVGAAQRLRPLAGHLRIMPSFRGPE